MKQYLEDAKMKAIQEIALNYCVKVLEHKWRIAVRDGTYGHDLRASIVARVEALRARIKALRHE